jgi:hypothetical protein
MNVCSFMVIIPVPQMDLSLTEMKDTGAGKLVTELRKHPSSSKLAEAARQIRETWMRLAGVVSFFNTIFIFRP